MVGMNLCPFLVGEFGRRYPEFKGDYLDFFEAPYRILYDPGLLGTSTRSGGFRAATGSTGTSLSEGFNTPCSSTAGAWPTSTIPIRTT